LRVALPVKAFGTFYELVNVGGRIDGDRMEERPLRYGASMFRCDPGRPPKTGISVTFRQSSGIDKP